MVLWTRAGSVDTGFRSAIALFKSYDYAYHG